VSSSCRSALGDDNCKRDRIASTASSPIAKPMDSYQFAIKAVLTEHFGDSQAFIFVEINILLNANWYQQPMSASA
jgi:hypothetical protein